MPPIPVLLTRIPAYDDTALPGEVARLLDGIGLRPAPGARVLVKPNLVAARSAHLSTTHPAVVRAACAYLLDCGARVTVADSPAFGSARSVARASGLLAALADLPVTLRSLTRPAGLRLSFGAPCPLGLLAASVDPHALDAALYALLGATPETVPLWREARRRGLPGAFNENLAFPLLQPGDVDAAGFVIPPVLDPVTFDPFRLVKGRMKSLCQRFF